MPNYIMRFTITGTSHLEDYENEDEAYEVAEEILYEFGGSWARNEAVIDLEETD